MQNYGSVYDTNRTDEPALAREVLADRNEPNTVERLLVQMAYLMGWQTPVGTYRDNSP